MERPSRRPAVAFAFVAALAAIPATAALDIAGLSQDDAPCDDFYAHANRRWLESTTIPDDHGAWNTFTAVDKRNKERLLRLLAEAAKSNPYPAGSNRHKVVAFYASGMDETAIAEAGLTPLEPLFGAIDAVRTAADLPAAIAALHRAGIRAGFAFAVRQDAKNARRYLAQIQQAGIGLPDRDYYFRTDQRSREQLGAYRAHLLTIFRLTGQSPPAAAALAMSVLETETRLARAHMTLVERRDPEKTYNPRTTAQLAREAPGFDWKAYFAAIGAPELAEVNLAQPVALAAFARLAAERPAEEWRAYLRWHVLNATATKLPGDFEAAHFAFFEHTLSGTARPRPRAERVVETIAGRYGGEPLAHALGEIFVQDAFPPQARQRALELVGHVKAALRDRLLALDWLDEPTRVAALAKLGRMAVKIGYPDRWRDFSTAPVGSRPYVENWLNANAFEFRRTLSRLGGPVDRDDWWMSPHTVNAYYGASLNEIVFPAGILQPPFFDLHADDAENFGGIGMVIGHEIMHGFDDRGRRFDAEGNLHEWWTPADQERYRKRAQAIVAQYDAYRGVDGLVVNGALTLGENIADQSGLRIAYFGLQRALEGKPREVLASLSPEQRFFLSFAQLWRALLRPEQERLRLLTDSHSPPRYRVLGSLANMPEFARAFSCGPEAKAPRAAGERVDLR